LSLVVLACFYGNAAGTVLLTLMVAVFKCFESISDIYQGFLQQQERMDCVAQSLILKGLLTLTFFGTVYFCSRSLLWATSAMAVAQLGTLACYDMRTATRLLQSSGIAGTCGFLGRLEFPQWHFKALKEMAIRALPLGIAMMLISLYANVPRFVLNRYIGASGLGIFAAINYLSMIGSMLVTAVGTAACPRLSQYAQNDQKAFRRLLSQLAAFAALLGVLGIVASSLIGRNLLLLLYGSEYAHYTKLLVWSMVAAALIYISSVFGFGATALGRLAGQPWAVAISTAVLFGSAVVLVPIYGLLGAVMASVFSSLIWLCAFIALVFWKRNDSY
jgi:O-antigen/teichoic acid export membrane protein